MTSYDRPPDVGCVVQAGFQGRDTAVFLASLPDGPVHVLNGVASIIWLEATRTETDERDVVERVAVLVEEPPDTVRPDVERFLAQLVGAGLLAPRTGADTSPAD